MPPPAESFRKLRDGSSYALGDIDDFADRYLQLVHRSEFYEPIERYKPHRDFIDAAAAFLPDTWKLIRSGVWMIAASASSALPEQGWKIHISATPDNAIRILRTVALLLVSSGTTFKFALDPVILRLMNSNMWQRGGSGKFITVYPEDESNFRFLLDLLYTKLRQEVGPYILSDRRYRDCRVLYYRYGGIRPRSRISNVGRSIGTLVSPDGEVSDDVRGPYFQLPAWVQDPFPAEKSLESLTLASGRYEVQQALAFTNCGGVYLAQDRSRNMVVALKEARPYTGYDQAGRDAAQRLQAEAEILRTLGGTRLSPEFFDEFVDWEHHFIAMEVVRGIPWNHLAPSVSNPILAIPAPYYVRRRWTDRLLRYWLQIAKDVTELHARGIVYGDVSWTNVFVDRRHGISRLIDFGAAWVPAAHHGPSIAGTPGFVPTAQKWNDPYAADRYAMGALLLSAIWPINRLLDLNEGAAKDFLDAIIVDAGLDKALGEIVVMLLEHAGAPDSLQTAVRIAQRPRALSDLRRKANRSTTVSLEGLDLWLRQIVKYLTGSLTFDRSDRVAPAGIELQYTNPVSLACGAAGVAYALQLLGEAQASLRIALWIQNHPIAKPGSRALPGGLYMGWSGIAWVMRSLCLDDAADEALEMTMKTPDISDDHSLYSGLAGVGLAFLHGWMATGRSVPRYLAIAEEMGARILHRAVASDRGLHWVSRDKLIHVGFAYGAAGTALFLLYLAAATGDKSFAEQGRLALGFDVSQATQGARGQLTLPEYVGARRHMPYLLHGTGGLATVLLRYYKHTREPSFRQLTEEFGRSARKKYTILPGLLTGLAGLANLQMDCYELMGGEEWLRAAYDSLAGVQLYALNRPSGVAFAGDHQKITCDYGDGSAGIAAVISRLVHGTRSPLLMIDELLD